jgi:hypothetical protein
MVNLGTDLDYILLFVGIIGNSSEINGEDLPSPAIIL